MPTLGAMEEKRIAALTMVRNDDFFLQKWISYYGKELGMENLYVYIDGKDGTRLNAECLMLNAESPRPNIEVHEKIGTSVVSAEKGRLKFLSEKAAQLLKTYDLVIGTDADEYLYVDPRLGMSLREFLSRQKIGTSLSGLGLDFGQKLPDEGPLTLDKPFLQQRHYAQIGTRYTKPSVIARPCQWGSGFHRVKGHNFHIAKGLYLMHFGYADRDIIASRLNDSDRKAQGWQHHIAKRSRTIQLVNSLKPRDFDRWTRIARVLQTICRPPWAWNKPGMLELKIITSPNPSQGGEQEGSIVERLIYNLRLILFGHILNPLWHSRLKRRQRRGQVIASGVEKYLEHLLGSSFKVQGSKSEDEEHSSLFTLHSSLGKNKCIFSIWFQGEDNAPQLVRSCWKSIREHSGMELVILDDKTLWQWIDFPDYIVQKWRSGKIRPANFSDLCRAELLWHHGGYWMDSTCFMTHPFPQFVQDADLFFYMAGDRIGGSYAFMQSCFIKANAHNPVIGAWRSAMYQYWFREDKALDYMINLMLMRYAVTHDEAAKAEFERMPKVVQDPTHIIWFDKSNGLNGSKGSKGVLYRDLPFDAEEFRRLTAEGAFQKTTYRTYSRHAPKPGSYAEFISSSSVSSQTA